MERTIGDGRVRNTGYDYEQTDGFGNTTRTTYDNFGRVTSTIDALGYATTSGYDALGRQTSVTDPLTNTVTTAYDADGRVVAQRGATYPVDYFYDEFGEKVSMTTYRDLNEGTGNGEQGTGNGAVQGDVTRWLRDEATGLITNKVYADGKGPRYDYTPDGKLATRTWARGIVTTYSYDDNGSLTNTVYSDGTPTISLAYNRAGRQIQAIDAAGVTTFAYDDFGAVTNETVVGVAGTNTIERYYDSVGRSLGHGLNGVRQSTLAYDPATGRLASMLAAGSDTPFMWNYLPGSDIKSSLAYPNGLTASWQYDANNQLLQVRNAFPTNTISQYDYVYDAAGRRVQISRSGSAMSENRTDVYGYNERGELISAAKNAESAEIEYAYEYDDIGNRMTSFDLGTNRTYIANNLNQYTQISILCDSASLCEEFNPQFDDDGNQTLVQTATGIWQVQYNGENRPVLWENVSTNSPTPNSSTPSLISMSFDRMGRRVQYLETCGNATNENKVFIYEGYLQVANFDFATQNAQRFAWDPTEPIATRPLVFYDSSTSPRFYTYDGNKNVTELISSVGSLVAAHYEYASFGTVFLGIGIDNKVNPFRFSSEYDDSHIGVVYYNYRHLNSIYGVWLNRDILEEDSEFGLYHFAGGLSVVDALGLDGVITIISEKKKRPDDGTSWITYKSDCGRDLKDGTKIKKNVEYSFHNYGNNNGLEKKLGLNIGYARKEGRDKNIRHSRTKQIDCSKEDEFFKFIEQSRAKGAKLHTLEHNCAVFATEAWKIATDETIDASNGKTVLKTFGTEKDIEKALRRNKMKHLVPMIPMIKNKSMPCPYNLADAIDAANAPKDSEEQK